VHKENIELQVNRLVYNLGGYLPLMPSSKINAIANVSFSKKKAMNKFSAFLQYQYSFKQNRIADYETPTGAYSLVNAGIYFNLHIPYLSAIRFDASVNNLFDERYYDHLSRYKEEGIYDIGRNFIFKLSVPIHVEERE